MSNQMNAMGHINLTRGMSLSKLLQDQSKNKSGFSRANMAVNKNLHMKSSISRKLLKAFRSSKNRKKSKKKIESKRLSMQFSDLPRKFSNEGPGNSSIPEYFRTQMMTQRERSNSKQ